jgi:hypothetical protein
MSNNIIKLEEKAKLFIPLSVQQQIDYLHKKVGSKEWCGVLLYSVTKGNYQNPETLELKVEGIYPLSIDSETYTEHEFNENILDLFKVYPKADMEVAGKDAYRYGLIHTHHNMSAFFSGTDENEQRSNAPNYDWYLSFIVNFSGNYVARVAFTEEVEYKYKYKSFLNRFTKFKSQQGLDVVKKTVILEFDLDIIKEEIAIENTPFLEVADKLVDDYILAKKAKETIAKTPYQYHQYPSYGQEKREVGFQQQSKHATWVTKDKKKDGSISYIRNGKTVIKPINNNTILDFLAKFLLKNKDAKFISVYVLVTTAYELISKDIKYRAYIIDNFETEAINYFGDHVDNTGDLTEILEKSIDIFDKVTIESQIRGKSNFFKYALETTLDDINPLIEDKQAEIDFNKKIYNDHYGLNNLYD